MYTIFCLLEGDYDPFSVKIDETESVDALKKAIKAENSATFEGVDARGLKLYHVNFKYDESDEQGSITQVNAVLQGLSNNKPLSALRELSDIEEGFPKGMVHILARLPPGESIHSRTCGGVAEAHPPNDLCLITALFFQ
jgi:hypothetical protein